MKQLVIIGGGFAGSLAAKKLEKHFDTVFIDTKDYFEFTPSVLRTIVEPEHAKKIQVLHSHYLHKAHLIRDEVTTITDKEVKTKKQSYPYDYLVIASGSKYATPIKDSNLVITARSHDLRNYAQKLKQSKQILIIGGGLVGIELAAEIACKFPKKEIILVHASSELIERNPQKARNYAKRLLEDKGVNIIFNERVAVRDGIYKTKKYSFKPDIAFLCVGIMPNYEHLAPHCSISLDEKNSLCVNKYLQVQNHKNVFAAGDITNIKEEKTAQSAEKQAEVVVKNICRLDKGRELKEYQTAQKPMVISLGKWNGILVYNNFILTGIIPGLMKSIIEWKGMIKYR
ncbi:MAG TPA: FAD-dependent oxidoreductase [Candidatus Nanoarchaeia archaeon]|nr:FAD-dependent oxidoreductase [Candidatus Nanoarchaeia archaeon]